MEYRRALILALQLAAEQAEKIEGGERILEKIREAQDLAERKDSEAVSAMRAVVSIAAVAALLGCAAWLMGEFPGRF